MCFWFEQQSWKRRTTEQSNWCQEQLGHPFEWLANPFCWLKNKSMNSKAKNGIKKPRTNHIKRNMCINSRFRSFHSRCWVSTFCPLASAKARAKSTTNCSSIMFALQGPNWIWFGLNIGCLYNGRPNCWPFVHFWQLCKFSKKAWPMM